MYFCTEIAKKFAKIKVAHQVYRAFVPESPEQQVELQAKYRMALDEMDVVFAYDRQRVADCEKLLSERQALKQTLAEELRVSVENQQRQLLERGLELKSSQTGKHLDAHVLNRWIKNMEQVRRNISEVRLNFIKTLDRHTEIDTVCFLNLVDIITLALSLMVN